MRRTRLSLYYLASYTTLTGLAMLLAPRMVVEMLFSNNPAAWGDSGTRLAGVMMLTVGVIVIQLIWRKAEALYPATLVARGVVLVSLTGLYFYSGDPAFLAMFGVVVIGVLLTGFSYWRDRG